MTGHVLEARKGFSSDIDQRNCALNGEESRWEHTGAGFFSITPVSRGTAETEKTKKKILSPPNKPGYAKQKEHSFPVPYELYGTSLPLPWMMVGPNSEEELKYDNYLKHAPLRER